MCDYDSVRNNLGFVWICMILHMASQLLNLHHLNLTKGLLTIGFPIIRPY